MTTITKASMKTLLQKLDSAEFADNFRATKLDVSLLTKLKKTLETILFLLNDDADFEERLNMVSHAVFELHNLFDQINTEAEYETLTPTPFQVLKSTIYSPFKQFNKVIKSKLLKLIERLELLSSGGVGGHKGELAVTDESSIYGRDSDINKLKNLLLSEDASDGDCKLRIISIVGMGGIGKTALAKHLYNHPQVKDKFELKLWADFSNDVDEFSVLETILESITSKKISSFNLNCHPLGHGNTKTSDVNTSYTNLLLTTLQQILSRNLFLLVLDDVWDAKSVNWIYLMDIFSVGEMGSKIIITTRDETVALSMQAFLSVHYLRPLEIEDCWSLLAKHAFGEDNYLQRPNLEKIGRKIAKNCDGLPLAAVARGTLLRTSSFTDDDWNYVLERNVADIPYNVLASLKLSYDFLSGPLKQCFQYCSIFPKKFILEKKMVIQLWIAAGLVKSYTDQEKVGEEYFDELVSRSLIHRRSIGDEEGNFEMHNVIHDLATLVSFPCCINMDEHNLYSLDDSVHLSYNRRAYDSYDKFYKLYGLKGLRTFLALPLQEQLPLCLLSNKVVHDLLPTVKQLRVLSLSSYKSITKVPNSIGKLLYMRYLNLSHTNIERLPSETCKLYNLQFLLLSGCKRLTELPEDMGKLVYLRHLDVSDTALREMPAQIAKLENLHTLSDFVVSKPNGGLKVAELGKFPHLHGKLSISQLQNVNDPSEAFQANMKMKEGIQKLALEWDYGSTFSDSQFQSAVLEHLRPSTNLKSLTIKGYGGISFPNWLGDSLFSNMVYLRISNCNDCLWLPPLGKLGNLKELVIEGMQSVETIGIEFSGSDSSSFQSFPSLKTLQFEDMQVWEEWNLIVGTTTNFPSLKSLSLSKCPKLRVGNIAHKFSSLTELELRECSVLEQSIPSSEHIFRQLIFPMNSLRHLTIDNFPSLMSFPTDGLPKTLKLLIISNCENLEFLHHDYLHNYTSLEELKISYSCNSMISFTLGTPCPQESVY